MTPTLDTWASEVWPRLFGFACRLCRNRDDAADLVQETLFQLMAGKRSHELPELPIGFALTALRRAWIALVRRAHTQKRRGSISLEVFIKTAYVRGFRDPNLRELARDCPVDTATQLREALSLLSPGRRAAVQRRMDGGELTGAAARQLARARQDIERYFHA